MAVPPRVQLGSDTLARDYYVDVNIGSFATPNWIPVNGWQELKPTFNPTTQDSSDYDSGPYKDSTVTAVEWGLEGKLGRKTTSADPTVYDPGQEVLRAAAEQPGINNRVDIRFYEMATSGPRVEAYRGFANVQWSPDGGGQDALRTVSVTLGGKGQRTAITHPDTATPPAPVIASVSPSTGLATAGGTQVTITGTNMASVTAVTFGGTAAASFVKIGSNTIVAVTPAKAAGTHAVVATNPGGASTGYNVTFA